MTPSSSVAFKEFRNLNEDFVHLMGEVETTRLDLSSVELKTRMAALRQMHTNQEKLASIIQFKEGEDKCLNANSVRLFELEYQVKKSLEPEQLPDCGQTTSFIVEEKDELKDGLMVPFLKMGKTSHDLDLDLDLDFALKQNSAPDNFFDLYFQFKNLMTRTQSIKLHSPRELEYNMTVLKKILARQEVIVNNTQDNENLIKIYTFNAKELLELDDFIYNQKQLLAFENSEKSLEVLVVTGEANEPQVESQYLFKNQNGIEITLNKIFVSYCQKFLHILPNYDQSQKLSNAEKIDLEKEKIFILKQLSKICHLSIKQMNLLNSQEFINLIIDKLLQQDKIDMAIAIHFLHREKNLGKREKNLDKIFKHILSKKGAEQEIGTYIDKIQMIFKALFSDSSSQFTELSKTLIALVNSTNNLKVINIAIEKMLTIKTTDDDGKTYYLFQDICDALHGIIYRLIELKEFDFAEKTLHGLPKNLPVSLMMDFQNVADGRKADAQVRKFTLIITATSLLVGALGLFLRKV